MKVTNYSAIRKLVKTGDPIVFGGYDPVCRIIKRATKSNASHIASVVQVKVLDDPQPDRFMNLIVEAQAEGVRTHRLSDRILHHEGEVWWLPLDRSQTLDTSSLLNWLLKYAAEHTPYDVKQAINSALDKTDRGLNVEDFSKLFCSELFASSLEAAGFIPAINASEVTPIDACRFKIYESDYYLLKGDQSKTLTRFNTMDPSLWNC